jgi:hypothetical protein
MAINVVTLTGNAAITGLPAAAPTTSETIADVTQGTWLEVNVGGTATTITVLRPGNFSQGDAVSDWVIGPLTSTQRFLRIGPEFADPADGDADVTFSQVTAVTARVFKV